MNIKNKCVQCGHELVKGQQTTRLMHGTRGFRSYAVCLKCAGKAPLSAGTQTSPHLEEHKMGGGQSRGDASRKAGV